MALELPELVRGACMVEMAPIGPLLLTAASLSLAAAVGLREAYDRRHPIKLGDAHEHGRLVLQWGLTVSLLLVMLFVLDLLQGGWFAPKAAEMGGWLRFGCLLLGGALSVRYGRRFWGVLTYQPEPRVSIIPEIDARPVATELDGSVAPPMERLEAPVPDPVLHMRRELAAFVAGLLLLFAALHGWNTASLCLARLPNA